MSRIGRRIILNSGGFPLPAVVLVQHKEVSGSGAAISATLDAAPTPGNVLFAFMGVQDHPGSGFGQTVGPSMTQVGGTVEARSDFGGDGAMFRRVVQAGDGSTYTFGQGASVNWGIFLAEFSGLDPSGPLGAAVSATDQRVNTVLALAFAQGALAFNIAGFVTRLASPSSGATFAPNGSSTQVNGIIGGGNDLILLVYGTGSITLGGTQGGPTRDGYCWGGVGTAWSKRAI